MTKYSELNGGSYSQNFICSVIPFGFILAGLFHCHSKCWGGGLSSCINHVASVRLAFRLHQI